jgi:hypothetical protein
MKQNEKKTIKRNLLYTKSTVRTSQSQIQGLSKGIQGHVYQQIQGLNTEEKALEISKM